MADGDQSKTSAEGPGFGMRLTIAGIKQKFPSVKNLSTDALLSLMETVPLASTTEDSEEKDKLLLLDSRPDEEYIVGHIQGARRVDYKAETDKLMSALPELQSPEGNITVVCYCSVGYRSSIVAEKISEYLKQKGSTAQGAVKVYNLEGSIFKWANENRPMVNVGEKATIYAHPYNAVFGKLLKKELRRTSVEDEPAS